MSQETRKILISAAMIFIVIEVGFTLLQSGNNEEEQEPSYKILFIGNSMTYWNDGLDQHLEKLASSADPPLIIKADSITQEGFHWKAYEKKPMHAPPSKAATMIK